MCTSWKSSNIVSILTPPLAPTSITVPTSTVTNGTINISWPAVSTATKYHVQESKNNGSWVTLTSTTTSRSYSRTSRTNGNYKYQVRAYNASGWGSFRTSANVTVLLPPLAPNSITVPTSTVTNGTINISWPAVSTATKYQIQESKNNGSWVTLTSTTTSRSYSRTSRTNGSYKYQVRAYNASGWGSFRASANVTVLLPPLAPNSITVPTSTVTNGTINISWPAVSTATKYQIQESKNNGSWITLTSTTTSRSYSRTSRTNGNYKYQVRAYNTSGWGSFRASANVTVLLLPLAPTSITVPTTTVTNGTISISWPAVSTATKYQLQESKNNGSWVTLTSTTTSRSYSRTSRTNGSYKYQVRAYNASGWGSFRASANVTVLLPSIEVRSLNALLSNQKIILLWTASQAYTGGNSTLSSTSANNTSNNIQPSSLLGDNTYTVEQKKDNGSWVTLTSSLRHSKVEVLDGHYGSTVLYSGIYLVSDLTGGDYTFRIRSCYLSVCTSWKSSNIVSILTPPLAPNSITVPTSTVTNGTINISWPAVSTATKYQIQESKNNSSWVTLTSTTTSRSYSRTSRTNGSYKYQVRAYNASGWGSFRASANVKVLLPPLAPTSITVPTNTVSNGTINISWPAVSTATKYQIQESKNNGSWVTLTSTTTSRSYSRTSRTNGNYKYQVRAYNASGWGNFRASANVTVLLPPLAPTSITVPTTTVSNGTINISWPAVSTATKYQIQESKNNGSWVTLTSTTASRSYSRIVKTDGSYKYQVRAYNASGWGSYSVSPTVTVNLPPSWMQKGGSTNNSSLISPSISASDFYGAIDGKASVNGGTANFSVPIELPPGRNGVQPNISLNYSSQTGRGIAGVGWSLNSGSSISRCGATYAQDGFTKNIMFNAITDRLCLDGQRLIAIEGVYGESQTQYKTELDSFIIVTQAGNINSSTSSFSVSRPDGSIATYGTTENSRFKPSGLSTTLHWKVTKESWANGNNNILYSYDTSVSGEHLLKKVCYSGCTDSFDDRWVNFIYENRTDIRTSYLAQGEIKSKRRLKEIHTNISTNRIFQYILNYSVSTASQRDLLASIEQCNGDICREKTTFEWHNELNYSAPTPLMFGGEEIYAGVKKIKDIMPYGDIDGNGTVDFPGYMVNAEQEVVGTNNYSIDNSCYMVIETATFSCMQGDFDRDGKIDPYKIVNGFLWIDFSSNNTSFQATNIAVDMQESYIQYRDKISAFNDINGDGWLDIVIYEHNDGYAKLKVYLHSSNSNTTFLTGQVIHNYTNKVIDNRRTPTENAVFADDFDGNGLVDLLITNLDGFIAPTLPMGSPKNIKLNQSKPGQLRFTTSEAPLAPIDQQTNYSFFNYFIDINGDGLTDLLGWEKNSLSVRINQGNAVFSDWQELSNTRLLAVANYTVPLGEEGIEISYPRYFKSLQSVDINNDGINELLTPGERLVEGCTVRTSTTSTCGDDIYRTWSDRVADAEKYDDSIYRYDAIYFDLQSDGSYTARKLPTDIIAPATQLAFIDAFGDGNLDVIFNYGARTNNSIPVPDTSLFDHDGAYIVRNYGSGTGQTPSDYNVTDTLYKVTNGVGLENKWFYRPLSSGITSAQQKFYQTDHNYQGDGYLHFGSSMYAVNSMQQSNGVGSLNEIQYAYEGAMYHTQGRGFTGFRRLIEHNVANDVITTSTFEQKFPKISLLTNQVVETSNQIKIKETQYQWLENPQHSVLNVFNNYLASSIVTTCDINAMECNSSNYLSYSETTISADAVDEYGNVSKQLVTTTDKYATYTNQLDTKFDATESWPNKVTSKTVTKSVSYFDTTANITNNTKAQITTHYKNYDSVHRKPTITYVAAGSVAASDCTTKFNCNKTITTYNDYGLVTSSTLSANILNTNQDTIGVQNRETRFKYSNNGTMAANDGYFVQEVKRIMPGNDHIITYKTHASSGQVKETNDISGVVTAITFDKLNRPTKIKKTGYPDSHLTYKAADSNKPNNAVMMIENAQAGAPTSAEYKDVLGRTIRSRTQSFDGSLVFSDVLYNARGLKTHESSPYKSVPVYTTYGGFDALGRATTKQTPSITDVYTTTYTYDGLTTSIDVSASIGNNISMSRTYNSLGQLIQTTDALNGVTRYYYNGGGQPISITDAANNSIKAHYDLLGRKTSVDDPNQGLTSFTYNGFNELEKEVDANNKTIQYDMDVAGRIVSRFAGSENASYVWDSKKTGLLTSQSQSNISKAFTYDAAARTTSSTITIDNTSYVTKTEYDANYGRPKLMVYPNQLSISYLYNSQGYLTTEQNAFSGYVYRKITEQDHWGNVTTASIAGNNGNDFNITTDYQFSNNTGEMLNANATGTLLGNQGRIQTIAYTSFDSYGNLTAQNRTDNSINSSATYSYDDLHRLTSSSRIISGTSLTVDYAYDAVGNFSKKSDFSTNNENAYSYVTGTNKISSVNLKGGGIEKYRYDNKGNLTHRNNNLESTYNVFNKPLAINKNNASMVFTYGADLARYKQVRNDNGKSIITHYIDKHYEVELEGSVKRWKAYISDIAIISDTESTTGNKKIHFTLRDRLGSAVTFADHNGVTTARRAFDPFGKPLGGDWSDLTELAGASTLANNAFDSDMPTQRGFTDHEHLDKAELIHMNGRVYDYNLGRFLSVDPFIQAPGNSQSMNPYSYIMNNPLSGTDPSGYCSTGTRIKDKDAIGCQTVYGEDDGQKRQRQKNMSNILSNASQQAAYNGFKKLATKNKTDGIVSQSDVNVGDSGTSGGGQYDGTYFFGGAGIDGDYIGDMVTAFQEAGISDVHAVNGPRWSMNDGEFPLLGTGLDAFIGVLALNEEIDLGDRINTTPERLINKGDGKGQFNLVGYSYGSLVAAQVAMTRVKKGGTVDNLVLVGSPIDSGFLKTLRSSPGIKNVMVKDLVQHGDTIKAGMSGASLFNPFVFVPLAKQFGSGTGHFHYAPMSQVGNSRRRELAKELYGAGLR